MLIEPGDRVLVTGASGFIGSAVTRALLARGAEVVALLQPGVAHTGVDDLEVERVEADLRDGSAVLAATKGCRLVFHVAALYRFWARDPAEFYEVNVGGSLNVVEAATTAGVERVVYTSTVGTIGLDGTEQGNPADETDWARIDHLFGLYKQSKYVAEHEVLRAAARGTAGGPRAADVAARSGRPGAHADRQDGARLPERAHPGVARHGAERRRRG